MDVSLSHDNLILRSFPDSDRALVVPALERVDLPLGFSIEKPDSPIRYIYFLEDGIASTVGVIKPKHQIEVGIVGREGLTGLPVVLGADRSPHATFMQVRGHGLRVSADVMRLAIAASPSLHASLLRFVQTFMIQISSTALANGRARLEARLARWLLMVHDRHDGQKLLLTHEFLAVMLGVRRPGVTVAIQILEGKGLLRATRGQVHILDRPGLIDLAGSCYGVAEAEYLRLTGDPLSAHQKIVTAG
jgi:CRP-like cAMP-binding protein